MEKMSRDDRLRAELSGLQSLKRKSSLFDFESEGEPPEKYKVTFIGKGVASINPDDNEAVIAEQHQIQIQLAYLHPKREPDLKWLTPIYHPNLSKSGFVDLKDIGLEWTEDLTLEIICERLWDVIRLAYVEMESATCLEAKEWFKNKLTLKLPIDGRPLRDRDVASQTNVVQYSRRNKKPASQPAASRERDVLFIGDETQTNSQATDRGTSTAGESTRQANQQTGSNRSNNQDDDILFID